MPDPKPEERKLVCPDCKKELKADTDICECGAPIGPALKFNRMLDTARKLREPEPGKEKKKSSGLSDFFDW